MSRVNKALEIAVINQEPFQCFFINRNKKHLSLIQWFSTGVPRNPWVPQKAVGVPPISEFDWYLLVKCR